MEERRVTIVEDPDGKKTVFIHDIRFKGKRSVQWEEVRKYLKSLVGHSENGKKYLYDILDIKKETSNPLGS